MAEKSTSQFASADGFPIAASDDLSVRHGYYKPQHSQANNAAETNSSPCNVAGHIPVSCSEIMVCIHLLNLEEFLLEPVNSLINIIISQKYTARQKTRECLVRRLVPPIET
jgi:hypothetical protein